MRYILSDILSVKCILGQRRISIESETTHESNGMVRSRRNVDPNGNIGSPHMVRLLLGYSRAHKLFRLLFSCYWCLRILCFDQKSECLSTSLKNRQNRSLIRFSLGVRLRECFGSDFLAVFSQKRVQIETRRESI